MSNVGSISMLITRVVAEYLKVVRQGKPKAREGGVHERGAYSPSR